MNLQDQIKKQIEESEQETIKQEHEDAEDNLIDVLAKLKQKNPIGEN